jgi:hypothetical protein
VSEFRIVQVVRDACRRCGRDTEIESSPTSPPFWDVRRAGRPGSSRDERCLVCGQQWDSQYAPGEFDVLLRLSVPPSA